jgi:hypothetical protein
LILPASWLGRIDCNFEETMKNGKEEMHIANAFAKQIADIQLGKRRVAEAPELHMKKERIQPPY